MNVQPRDRRRWFAAHFGNTYFKTESLGSPLLMVGLAVPLLAIVLLAVFAVASIVPDVGNVAIAVTPALAVAREKAARAYKAACDIRDEMKTHQGPWPADKQASFDTAMAEFTSSHNEAERLKNADSLEQYQADYVQATNPVTQPPPNTPATIGVREVFSRVVRFGRFDPKQNRVVAKGVPNAIVDQCLEIHGEAFSAFIRNDRDGVIRYGNEQKHVAPKEIHALLSNDDTLGGFLVPDDVRAEIIKAEAQIAVLAPLCRVENTSRDSLVFPKLKKHASDVRRTSGFTGTWRQQGYVTGGTAPTVQNQPTFEQERIPVHAWQPDAVEVSTDLIDDAAANVEGIIAEAIAECKALDLEDAILNGEGVKDPEGILRAGISTVNSGGATSIAIGGLIGMYTELPAQYRSKATWVMASRTMGAILQLNTGTGGVYLFPPNQWNETILTRPVKFLDYGMDTATAAGGTTFTAAEKPIIFGDWKRYVIAQRRDLRIQRLIERFAPNVGFLPTSRVGGQCVFTDAFRIMTVAA